ncbi:MAG: hypothetical protein GXZ08_07695 [Tissierellia bacterium]|nr:hypothetical protein [Tissierellia bacterium]
MDLIKKTVLYVILLILLVGCSSIDSNEVNNTEVLIKDLKVVEGNFIINSDSGEFRRESLDYREEGKNIIMSMTFTFKNTSNSAQSPFHVFSEEMVLGYEFPQEDFHPLSISEMHSSDNIKTEVNPGEEIEITFSWLMDEVTSNSMILLYTKEDPPKNDNTKSININTGIVITSYDEWKRDN